MYSKIPVHVIGLGNRHSAYLSPLPKKETHLNEYKSHG